MPGCQRNDSVASRSRLRSGRREAGVIVGEVRRKMGVAEATFHRWKKVSAGMGVAEIRRLKRGEPGSIHVDNVLCRENLTV